MVPRDLGDKARESSRARSSMRSSSLRQRLSSAGTARAAHQETSTRPRWPLAWQDPSSGPAPSTQRTHARTSPASPLPCAGHLFGRKRLARAHPPFHHTCLRGCHAPSPSSLVYHLIAPLSGRLPSKAAIGEMRMKPSRGGVTWQVEVFTRDRACYRVSL
jgi:hypothetical protein